MPIALRFVLAACACALASAAWGADAPAKSAAKPAVKPAPRAPTTANVTPPPQQLKPDHRMQCKVGPYEKQTRFVMETAKGKPVYIAYWSSNGPFRCSFESRPQDGYATWMDASAGTVITLIKGTVLIENDGNHYTVTARDVDRMTYCGTDGLINGVLTVPRKGGECTWKETSAAEAGHLN
ncbi:MAG: hypothetical protein ACREUW_14415 [Burkholderiales bacterium]